MNVLHSPTVLSYFIMDTQFSSRMDHILSILLLFLGLATVLLAIYFIKAEQKASPLPTDIRPEDLQITPAQVSYLFDGILHPEYALAATLMDWTLRDLARPVEGGFEFNALGPLLPHERSLMDFFTQFGPTFSFKEHARARSTQQQEYFQGLKQWFVVLEKNMVDRGLIYGAKRDRGRSLQYAVASVLLFFVAFYFFTGPYLIGLPFFASGVIFAALGLRRFGDYPPRGKRVYNYYAPLRRDEGQPQLSPDAELIYRTALAQDGPWPVEGLSEKLRPFAQEKPPHSLPKELRKSLIGTMNLGIF
ncbi:MAG: DUF2207 domain-containing protein [Tissierellia bacterium]|nr:DUF2207 domain-containing protein [Tissierellia bacterium]